jgi:hypothetical protein
MGPLQATQRPVPVPDNVYAWAVELACIWIENPSGLLLYQLSEEKTQFSEERRATILEEARASMLDGPNSALSPSGDFPQSHRWPDPVHRWGAGPIGNF